MCKDPNDSVARRPDLSTLVLDESLDVNVPPAIEQLGKLAELRVLDLTRNQLGAVPDSACDLPVKPDCVNLCKEKKRKGEEEKDIRKLWLNFIFLANFQEHWSFQSFINFRVYISKQR